MSNII
jgi:hypothetical protein